jgi:hypothetical protein
MMRENPRREFDSLPGSCANGLMVDVLDGRSAVTFQPETEAYVAEYKREGQHGVNRTALAGNDVR